MTAQASYVYLAYGESTRYVKVGKTTNLPKRLRTLQHGVPFILTLLWAERVADIDHAEGILKQRYAPYRTRGEWFAIPPAVLAQWGIAIPQTTAYEETYKVELVMLLRRLATAQGGVSSHEFMMTIWKLALQYKRPAAHLVWLRRQGFIEWNTYYYCWITQEGREYLASLDT